MPVLLRAELSSLAVLVQDLLGFAREPVNTSISAPNLSLMPVSMLQEEVNEFWKIDQSSLMMKVASRSAS